MSFWAPEFLKVYLFHIITFIIEQVLICHYNNCLDLRSFFHSSYGCSHPQLNADVPCRLQSFVRELYMSNYMLCLSIIFHTKRIFKKCNYFSQESLKRKLYTVIMILDGADILTKFCYSKLLYIKCLQLLKQVFFLFNIRENTNLPPHKYGPFLMSVFVYFFR